MEREGKEAALAPPRIEDFSTKRIEIFGKGSLLVDKEVVAADKWPGMVAATQLDFRERGIVVSRRSNGKLMTSKVFEGLGERFDYDNRARKIPSSFSLPLLPHGARSLLPKIKDIVVVHSHPMPPEVDHLQTTAISDVDIHSFINADYNALVMVDRGGAHLLVRVGHLLGDILPAERNIVEETIEAVSQERGGARDVIKSLATQLPSYGLGYFYTPTLSPDPKEGYVKFYNPGTLR